MSLGHADELAQADAGTRLACDHRWVVREDDRGEDCAKCRTCRLRVHLDQVPADALEVLVDRGTVLNVGQVAAGLEHRAHTIDVRNGLRLLQQLKLAALTFDDRSLPQYSATEAGAATIADARARHARREHERAICAATGHEWTPFRGGQRCAVCGTDGGATSGTKREGADR